MPRDANGNTQPLPGTIVSTGDTVLPSQHNPMVVDVYAMMTQSLSRDGQGGMRANLDMSTFKATNLADGTAAADAINKSQLDALVTGGFVGGAQYIIFDNLNIMVQIGSSVVTTAPTGGGTVSFPTVFDSAPIGVIATNGNATAFTGTVTVFPVTNGTGFTFRTEPPLVSAPVRVNWLAIGAKA